MLPHVLKKIRIYTCIGYCLIVYFLKVMCNFLQQSVIVHATLALLHQLPISQRIQSRIASMVSRCVLRCAPSYLRELCCPVSVLAARRVMRSAARGEFLVPRARLAIMQRRAFSVVGPSAWNDLPFELCSLLMAHPSKFYISLKSFFVRDWAGSAYEQQPLEEVLYKSLELLNE